jgi:hypothetical protein
MFKIKKALFFIYKNRYKNFVYKDNSKILIFIFYIASLLYINKYNNIYITYVLFMFLFIQIFVLHSNREDYNLLYHIFGRKKLIILLLIDYFLYNLPLLIFIFIKSNVLFISISIFIFVLPFTRLSLNKKLIYSLPLNSYDPVYITYIRKYPFIIVVVFLSYYLHIEGISYDNINLVKGTYFAIPFVNLLVNSNRDKIIFIKLSKLSEYYFILNLIKSHLSFIFIFMVPHIIIDLISNTIDILTIFMAIVLSILILLLRYIFFFNTILFSIASLILFFISFSLTFYTDNNIYYVIFIFVFILLIIFKQTLKSIKKLKTNVIY